MKNVILSLFCLGLLPSAACAGAPAKGAAYKAYSMDNGYFSCQVPSAWAQQRDKERDEEYRIYELQLQAPKAGRLPTLITVGFYHKENPDFAGHQDFVDSNSKNALGETKSARETYEPVKPVTLAGRKALLLARERLVFLHPESKSDESAPLKERMYVLPAKDGFYVLKLSAVKDAFPAALPVFEKVAKSFKGLP